MLSQADSATLRATISTARSEKVIHAVAAAA